MTIKDIEKMSFYFDYGNYLKNMFLKTLIYFEIMIIFAVVVR